MKRQQPSLKNLFADTNTHPKTDDKTPNSVQNKRPKTSASAPPTPQPQLQDELLSASIAGVEAETRNVDHEEEIAAKLKRWLGTRSFAERCRPQRVCDLVQHPQPMAKAQTLLQGFGIQSVLIWGPTGVGKTTWSRILSQELSKHLRCTIQTTPGPQLSTKDINGPERPRGQTGLGAMMGTGTDRRVLFCDEIHRISKVQQDALLGPMESGQIVLVGVTTENPFACLAKAFCSRCTVLHMKAPSETEWKRIIKSTERQLTKALENDIIIEENAVRWLRDACGSDIRHALSCIETAIIDIIRCREEDPLPIINSHNGRNRSIEITSEVLESQGRHGRLLYDANDRYDLISAFQKSIRASDRDAAMLYLARMLEGGEDPMYVARRLAITAAEDCDDMNAYCTAVAGLQAAKLTGMPECRLHLAYATQKLCEADKSAASHDAYLRACSLIRDNPNLPVPAAIANSGPARGLYRRTNQPRRMSAAESRAFYQPGSFLPEALREAKLFDDDEGH